MLHMPSELVVVVRHTELWAGSWSVAAAAGGTSEAFNLGERRLGTGAPLGCLSLEFSVSSGGEEEGSWKETAASAVYLDGSNLMCLLCLRSSPPSSVLMIKLMF